MTLLSVIIPTYNRKTFLLEAVASVFAQTLTEIECIVVDDGSTDGTPEAVTTAFPEVVLIRKEHGGVSSARNRGIAHSRGHYLALLDSDDLFHREKCRQQVDFLEKHPELLLVHSDEVWIRNGRELQQDDRFKRGGGDQFFRSLDRCIISPSSAMLRCTIFDQIGLFDESMPACEDYDLWLRVTSGNPVGFLPKVLVTKRGGHPDQLSVTTPALDYWRLFSLLKLLRSNSTNPEQREALLVEIEIKAAIVAIGRKKRGKEDAEFYKSLASRCLKGDIPELPAL